MSDEFFDGLYVVRAIMGDREPTVVIKTTEYLTADLKIRQVRSFPNHRESWVDLEDHHGRPHPCVSDEPEGGARS